MNISNSAWEITLHAQRKIAGCAVALSKQYLIIKQLFAIEPEVVTFYVPDVVFRRKALFLFPDVSEQLFMKMTLWGNHV